MKKQINEASVKIDMQGLESSDLESLSRMLALAGQAEKNAVQSQVPSVHGIPAPVAPIEPLDFDNIGSGDTQPILNPMDAPSADDFSDESTVNSLDNPVPTGLESYDESTDGVDGEDDFGPDDISNEQDSDDGFDMDRMSSLAGIHEGLDIEENDDVPDDSEDENDTDLDESLLPDLSLDEDSIASDAVKDFGPFNTEFECVADGQEKTNGVEGDNFIVVPKGNKFYWRRTVQEDCENRPEPEVFDDDGIIHSKHEYRHKRTALGDNPLLTVTEDAENEDSDNSDESDESEEDGDSVDSIFESINAKYKKFMEENK